MNRLPRLFSELFRLAAFQFSLSLLAEFIFGRICLEVKLVPNLLPLDYPSTYTIQRVMRQRFSLAKYFARGMFSGGGSISGDAIAQKLSTETYLFLRLQIRWHHLPICPRCAMGGSTWWWRAKTDQISHQQLTHHITQADKKGRMPQFWIGDWSSQRGIRHDFQIALRLLNPSEDDQLGMSLFSSVIMAGQEGRRWAQEPTGWESSFPFPLSSEERDILETWSQWRPQPS